jgi:hypothetical protein
LAFSLVLKAARAADDAFIHERQLIQMVRSKADGRECPTLVIVTGQQGQAAGLCGSRP